MGEWIYHCKTFGTLKGSTFWCHYRTIKWDVFISLYFVEWVQLLETNSLYEFLQRFLVLCQISRQRGQPKVFLKKIKRHPTVFFPEWILFHLEICQIYVSKMGSNLTIDCDVFQTGVPVRMGSTQRCDLHRPQRLSIYILTRVVREGHEEPAFISPLTCCHFYQSLTYCISAVHNLVFLVFSGFSLGH